MPRPALAALLAVALLAARATHAQGTTPATPAPRAEFAAPAGGTGPFSTYVRVGETVYLSGVLGTGADGALAPGGIGPETRQALTNIRTTLARAGATMDDVVKCTVFLADMAEWGAMNEVYTTFFAAHKPARSAVGVNGLARNARTEIECVAVRGAGGR